MNWSISDVNDFLGRCRCGVCGVWGAVLLFIQHFLISRNWFLDIKKWIPDIKKWILDITKYFLISRNIFLYQEFDILISRIRYLDIKNSISWYQEFDFLISRNIFWGAVLLFIKYFLISRIWFLDDKKWKEEIRKWGSNRFLLFSDFQ